MKMHEAMTLPDDVVTAGRRAFKPRLIADDELEAIYHAMSTKLAEQDDAVEHLQMLDAIADWAAKAGFGGISDQLREAIAALSTRTVVEQDDAVERVARVICKARFGNPDAIDSYDEEPAWKAWADAARAAIATLSTRVPSHMSQAAPQPTADQVETAAYKRGFADGQIGLEAAIDVAVAEAIASPGSGPAEGWPTYDKDIPNAFDAYLAELVGYDQTQHWARLPGTFRWYELWERIGKVIAIRPVTPTGKE